MSSICFEERWYFRDEYHAMIATASGENLTFSTRFRVPVSTQSGHLHRVRTRPFVTRDWDRETPRGATPPIPPGDTGFR
jgi:hypothetical protein